MTCGAVFQSRAQQHFKGICAAEVSGRGPSRFRSRIAARQCMILSEVGLAPSGSPAACLKASQSFAAAAAKESPIIFFGDMCGEENTSQAASVEFVCRRRINYARSRLQPLCQKVILFDSNDPAGSCPWGDGSACSKTSQSFAAAAAKESLDHFLRRHVRRRKYFSACKRAHRPPKADGACAAAGRKPFRQKSTTFLTKTTPQAIACGVASL